MKQNYDRTYRKGKKRIEREETEEEIAIEKELENIIPFDSHEPIKREGKWFKRCLFCDRVFVVKSTHYTQEMYCSMKCKMHKDQATKRHTFVCTNCGKTFSRSWDKHQEHNFCCFACAIEFQSKEKARAMKICEYCGKEYYPKYNGQRFCSTVCQNNWQKIVFRGEGNPRYRKDISIEDRTVVCPICGKNFIAKNATLATRQVYCSMKCKRKGFRNSLVQQELYQEVLKLHPEAQEEYQSSYYSFDCFVAPNLVVEMMGDYWHGNPIVFPRENWDKLQQGAHIKDTRKRRYLVSKRFKFLYIWENDWREEKEKCLKLLELFFSQGLPYHDSFNYEFKEGEVIPKQNIIDFYSDEND